MSADAKIWIDNGWWSGVHDGECQIDSLDHEHDSDLNLSIVIADIEKCVGHPLRWDFRIYPDGKIGLVGYA